MLGRALAATLLLATSAFAQGGWTTERHRALGLTFPRARDYEQVPTQPGEDHVVLFFAEKVPDDPKLRRAMRPEMSFVWIDYVPDPPELATSGTEAPVVGAQAKNDAPKPPINSLKRFVEQRLSGWELGAPIDKKVREGWQGREHALVPPKSDTTGQLGWVLAWTRPERTIAVFGFAHERDFEGQRAIWRGTAEKIDFDEPEERSSAEIERIYARTKLSNPEYRVAVRKKLVRGWKAEDTENYIVVYDTPDQPLMRRVIADLESVRREYVKLFPPAKPFVAVSTVRVCKNRDEYLSYGGSPTSAGYWNSAAEELVLYDAEKQLRDFQKSDADTFIVLYHEAFHQYVHYSTGELPPHSWFNEGHGDYFSGARISAGKVKGIGVNPWRVRTIQRAIEDDEFVPWKEIVRYEQAQYYEPAKVGVCYAQGWSMVYFLRTSKDVAKHERWSRILPTYFDVLKSSYAEELATLEAAGKKDDKVERWKSGLAARTKAVDAAFEGVDYVEIEAAWRKFTLSLEPPKEK